jgi:hypothetical protein
MPLNIESNSVGGCACMESIVKEFLSQYESLK